MRFCRHASVLFANRLFATARLQMGAPFGQHMGTQMYGMRPGMRPGIPSMQVHPAHMHMQQQQQHMQQQQQQPQPPSHGLGMRYLSAVHYFDEYEDALASRV